MFTWTISSVLWDSAIDASCVHCTRLCVWEREWMRECFIGAQTFLLALQNQNKKTHCTNATFLGLLTACKFLQTQTSFSSVRKISLCIIVSCYEWVCGRERERKRPFERNGALFELCWVLMELICEIVPSERGSPGQHKWASCLRNPCGKHPKAGKRVRYLVCSNRRPCEPPMLCTRMGRRQIKII